MSLPRNVWIIAIISSLVTFTCFLFVSENSPLGYEMANTEIPIFTFSLDKQVYHVTDGIIATYLIENTGDSPLTFTPPELVYIKGGYVGEEGVWLESISAPRTWMPSNVTVPPHSIKVIDHLGFQTDRVGLFEIVCNGFSRRVMIYP